MGRAGRSGCEQAEHGDRAEDEPVVGEGEDPAVGMDLLQREVGDLREEVPEEEQQRHEPQRRHEQHRDVRERGGVGDPGPDLEPCPEGERLEQNERDDDARPHRAIVWNGEGDADRPGDECGGHRGEHPPLARRHGLRAALPCLGDKPF